VRTYLVWRTIINFGLAIVMGTIYQLCGLSQAWSPPPRLIHPTSMNMAVIRPQAMKAPMFGSTMLDKNVPNLCTCTRAPPRDGAVAVDAIGSSSLSHGRDACHVSMWLILHVFGHIAKHSGINFCPFVWLFW
jgi:hypothetical protein